MLRRRRIEGRLHCFTVSLSGCARENGELAFAIIIGFRKREPLWGVLKEITYVLKRGVTTRTARWMLESIGCCGPLVGAA